MGSTKALHQYFVIISAGLAMLTPAAAAQDAPEDPVADYVKRFHERFAKVESPPALAEYASPERYDALYMGDAFEKAIANPSNDQGGLAWGLAAQMQSLNIMYRATKDPKYLEANLKASRAVLAVRDDKRGVKLWTGVVAPAWGSDKYADRGRAVFAVHTGIITYVILDCVRLAASDETLSKTLGDEAKAITDACVEALAFHDVQWRDGPGTDEGHYVGKDQEEVCENKPLPGNRLSAMGRALWVAWKLTGNEEHRDRAVAIGRYVKNRLTVCPVEGGKAYCWPYWLPLEAVGGEGTIEAIKAEDTSHGSLTASFPIMLALDGEVFGKADVELFGNTLLHGFAKREDGVVFANVAGTPALGPRYVSGISMWLPLASRVPGLRERVARFYLTYVPKPSPRDLALLVAFGRS